MELYDLRPSMAARLVHKVDEMGMRFYATDELIEPQEVRAGDLTNDEAFWNRPDARKEVEEDVPWG